ncbi:type III secretion system translocon subunit SctE [Parashewanella tropica]|uniref:type III secretion system translocon subunit SctE n=1 Tax=Parashewanella tropica TaxID=2547970 RepID=UPI00105A62EF|nr:type III secretion system translocon subunit SctE [Parashewanella tropica]
MSDLNRVGDTSIHQPMIDPSLLDGSHGSQSVHHAKLPTFDQIAHQSANAYNLADEIDKRNGLISRREADKALKQVLAKFDGNVPPSIADLEKANMQAMVLLATNLSISTFSDTAQAKLKAQKIMTDTQAYLNDQKVKKYQQQMKDRADQQAKARKAGIFTAIFDWIISAAEAIYGIIKIVEGVASAICSFGADAEAYVEVLSGATYLAAGAAGLVKAAAETCELAGVGDKKTEEEVAKIAGYVQLGCEIAGMCTDIFGAGLAFKAARGAASAVEEGVKIAADVAIKTTTDLAETTAAASIDAGAEGMVELEKLAAKEAVEQLSKDIAEQVASDVGDSIVTKISSKAAEVASEKGTEEGATLGRKIAIKLTRRMFKRVSKEFGKEAIKEMTQKVVQEAIEETAKQAAKEGGEITEDTVKDMAKLASKKATQRLMKGCVKISTNLALDMGRGAVSGGQQITQGTIAEVRAVTEKAIEELILEQDFLEFTSDWYDRTKQDETKSAKDLISKAGTAVQGGTDVISQTGTIRARIASSIAG